MKFFWLFISALFFAPSCEAQESQLPPQMPEKVAISFNQTGGMSRSFRRFRIENGKLEFESKENQQQPQKWSSSISRADLAKLYRVFVENKFETIKNDERQGIVYDAGSESIGVSAGAGKYFGVTYGKNSPLSGINLQRYQAVKKALDDFVARRENEKTKNSSDENQASSEAAEKRIRGVWRAEGKNGRYGWFLEWTFADGIFKQKGYPPIYQAGKYRIIGVQEDKITIELYDQKGNFGDEKRTVEIIVGGENESLTISGTGGFLRTTAKRRDEK